MQKLHRYQRVLYLVGIVAVFLFALYFALAGVDFGTQWDQNQIKGLVNKYVRTGNILPGWYHYPPGSSYIAASATIPYALPFVARYGSNWVPTQRYLLDDVLKNDNETFLLNLRRVFVFVTMLGILWTGLAAAQKNWLAGLVAAAVLAFSWELNYHSRIVHPDGPTMQFIALSLLFAMLAIHRRRPLDYRIWLGLAAVFSAAATATKYTAGISILAVLVLAYATMKTENAASTKRILLTLATLTIIFVATFLLLVPGVFLETSTFVEHVVRDQEIYAEGHGRQTVNAGWDYLQRVFLYLFQAAFSHNPILAVLVPSLSLIGVYALLKTRNREQSLFALALGGIPLLYILFLASHRVLFVRNLLIIFPSIVILAGIGFSWLFEQLQVRAPRWQYVLIGASLLFLAANGQWISYTARTIQMRHTDLFADQALASVSEQADQTIYITPLALVLLAGRELPTNTVTTFSDGVDLVLFAYRADTKEGREGSWPVNYPGASPLLFGPMEINMDWYASWPGSERLVLAEPEWAWDGGDWLLP